MWSNVIENLMLYRDYICFSALLLVLIGIIGMIVIRYINWKSITLKSFGIFVGLKAEKLVALSIVLVRILFIWSIIIFPTNLKLTHACFFILTTIIIHILLADLKVLIFDLCNTVLSYGLLYINNIIHSYLNGIQMKGSIIVMLIVVNLFIVFTTLYSTLVCVGSTVLHSQGKKHKLHWHSMLQQTALIISGVFILGIPYFFMNRMDTLTINQDMYQYSEEGRTDYIGINKITKSGNRCVLENNGRMYELSETPLYYSNENEILLTTVVSIIQPKLSLTNRIANMSRLYEKDGKYYVKNEKDTIKVSEFFLFDGKNTYLFFEPVTISWDKQTVNLEPFSYITVKYNQLITFFDTKSGASKKIDTGSCTVMAKMNCGTTINLSTDIFYQENGQEQMLFIQPNLLEDLQ